MKLHNYKVWNPNLGQFVAQPDMRSADEISALGGIIIPRQSSIPGFAEPVSVSPTAEPAHAY